MAPPSHIGDLIPSTSAPAPFVLSRYKVDPTSAFVSTMLVIAHHFRLIAWQHATAFTLVASCRLSVTLNRASAPSAGNARTSAVFCGSSPPACSGFGPPLVTTVMLWGLTAFSGIIAPTCPSLTPQHSSRSRLSLSQMPLPQLGWALRQVIRT